MRAVPRRLLSCATVTPGTVCSQAVVTLGVENRDRQGTKSCCRSEAPVKTGQSQEENPKLPCCFRHV